MSLAMDGGGGLILWPGKGRVGGGGEWQSG